MGNVHLRVLGVGFAFPQTTVRLALLEDILSQVLILAAFAPAASLLIPVDPPVVGRAPWAGTHYSLSCLAFRVRWGHMLPSKENLLVTFVREDGTLT